MHAAPKKSLCTQAASATLTTNQPSLVGVSPSGRCSSRALSTAARYRDRSTIPGVEVRGLAWLGTRTAEFEPMVAFLKEVFGLTPEFEDAGFAVFRLGNGDTVEVFGADDAHHAFFTTGPVA